MFSVRLRLFLLLAAALARLAVFRGCFVLLVLLAVGRGLYACSVPSASAVSSFLGLFSGFFYRRLGFFYRRLGCLYRYIVRVFLAFLPFFLYLCTIIIKEYRYGKV